MSATTTDDIERADLHRKMDAEIAKLIAETAKLNRETRAYPWLPILTALIGSSGLVGAGLTAIAVFHK